MTEPQIDDRRRFAMIPEEMLFDGDISGEAVKVFGVLHRYGSTPDKCFPSVKLVAEKASISTRSVRRHIALLESKGWLQRVPRTTEAGDPDSNAYRLFPQRTGTDTTGSTPSQDCQHPQPSVSGGYGQQRQGGTDTNGHIKRASEREPVNETPSPHGEAEVIDISTREARPPTPTFDDFWAIWPKKVGKLDSRKAWDKAVKRGVDPHVIVEGARRLAANPPDKQYIKYPQGWINGHRWEDEDEDLTRPRRDEAPPRTSDAFEGESYKGGSAWG